LTRAIQSVFVGSIEGTTPTKSIKLKIIMSDFLKFKLTQYFRLRGVSIPTNATEQKSLISKIPQSVKKQWAMEAIAAGV